MRGFATLTLLLSACASVPHEPPDAESRAFFPGSTIEQVRAAAVATLNDLSRFIGPARVTEDGRVVSESGWTSYELRFEERRDGVAAEVRIEAKPQFSCPGRGYRPVEYAAMHALLSPAAAEGEYRRATPILPRTALEESCEFRTQPVRHDRDEEILEGIRTRLAESHAMEPPPRGR